LSQSADQQKPDSSNRGGEMSITRILCGRPLDAEFRAPAVMTGLALCMFLLIFSHGMGGQTPQPTDLQFHKFQPKVSPGMVGQSASAHGALPNASACMPCNRFKLYNRRRPRATPAQQKIDSNILYTVRMLAGESAAPRIPSLDTGIELDNNDNIVVDMVANVTDSLLYQLSSAHAQVLYTNAELRSIRALIPTFSPLLGLVRAEDSAYACVRERTGGGGGSRTSAGY
jgi:hypothetical protein